MGTTYNAERTFGVEIETNTSHSPETLATAINAEFNVRGISQRCEFVGYDHITRNFWKIVRDVTVNGWELVSPPMKGLDARDEIDAVCTALRNLGCTVGANTGLHVHHDAADLSPKQLGMVFGTYAAFETLLSMSVAPSRRNNGMTRKLQTLAYSHPDAFNDQWNDVNNRPMAMSKFNRMIGTRYATVNYEALQRHGTIEFRQHQGTLNTSKIWAWVLVTQSIIERAVQGKANFPKPIAQVREETGRSYNKGEYARFKRFIAVIARYNDDDEDASAPYCEAFKYLRKSIKKFAKSANIDIMEIE